MKEILTKALSLLIVLILSTTSLYAQAPIKKPQKKTTTTNATTTQQKPRTNTSVSTNNSSQSISSTKGSEPTGYINGHEWVDLGLSVKWATCNVGATSPSDYGNYYAWGEIRTKVEYLDENSITISDKNIGSIAGRPTYDVARAHWGGTWRLPTEKEIDELVGKCVCVWTTQGGINGYKITGPSGNSIFFPAAGWYKEKSLNFAGQDGIYWGATPSENNACCLYFDNSIFSKYWGPRSTGQSVRPVSE